MDNTVEYDTIQPVLRQRVLLRAYTYIYQGREEEDSHSLKRHVFIGNISTISLIGVYTRYYLGICVVGPAP